MTPTRSSRTILLASCGALLLAAALLVTIVLPAEYGWDPLGTGGAMGLLELTGEGDTPLHVSESNWQSDRIEFQLAPFEAVEYKYQLAAGATLLYTWQADGELLYDMHAEPEGAAPGYAESFAKSRSGGHSGSYTAPFPGIHGWFWQNRTQQDITLVLQTHGFYTQALEMRGGKTFRYQFTETPDVDTQP